MPFPTVSMYTESVADGEFEKFSEYCDLVCVLNLDKILWTLINGEEH